MEPHRPAKRTVFHTLRSVYNAISMIKEIALFATVAAPMGAAALADLPIDTVGSTGAIGVLLWLVSTARGALTDYRDDVSSRKLARVERVTAEALARNEEKEHRAAERKHWLIIEERISARKAE